MSGARELRVEFAPGASPLGDVGTTYLYLPGTLGPGGSAATAPDSAPLSITGDLDLRVEFYCDDTRNLGPVPIAKWTETGDQRSYAVEIFGDHVGIIWSTDGTTGTLHSHVADERIPDFTGPVRMAIRATLDVDNGAGGNTGTFYTADSIDGPWTQLGTPQVFGGGTTSIFDSTAIVQVGNINFSGTRDDDLPFIGRIYAVEIRSGIDGTVVGNPDFTIQTAGDTSFQDTASAPNTWTVVSPAEIQGSAWVDLSSRVLGATWTQGRADELEPHPAGTATVVLKNDDRVLDPDYTAGTYFGQLLPRVPFRLRSRWSSLDLPASAGAGATTPDHASLAFTDLDVRVQLAMDDWTPGGFGQTMAGQWGSAGNEGWQFSVNTSGNLVLSFTTDGTTDLVRTSTAATGFTDGSDHWVRVTLDANNGAAGHDVRFYTSSDGASWTQLGSTVTTAGTVTPFNSTANLTVGSPVAGLDPAAAVRYFEMRSGIDGVVVASADFLGLEPGTTSFRDSSDKLWTVGGGAVVQIDTAFLTDEFYGFVEGGWEQELKPPEGCNCTVQLVDRLGVIGGYTLRDVFEHSVLINQPEGFWILDQPDSAEHVPDLSGAGNDGVVVGGVQFDQTPIRSGHRPSALFTAEANATNDLNRNFVNITDGSPIIQTPSDATIVATFKARTEGSLNFHQLFIQNDGNVAANKNLQMLVKTSGVLHYTWAETGGGLGYDWPVSVVDGLGHIAFGQGGGIAVDTADLSTSTAASGIGVSNGVGIGGHAGIQAVDGWDGWIGAVALFSRDFLIQEREIVLDGYGKLDGETTDQHVAWALDRLGVLDDHRNLDTGSVLMGPADTAGQDVLNWIREVTDTEQGQFYADHRDGGKFRFVQRYSRFTQTRSVSAQYRFSDNKADSSPNLVRVERGDLDLVPNGVNSIVNQVNAGWRSGTEVVSDTSSVSQYGPRPRDVATQSATPQQARSAGEWLVARYAQPRTRIDGVGTFPGADRRGYRAAYHLRVGDRVEVTYHPQEVGTEVTQDLFVEGVEQRVENGVNWYAHYALSPADTFTPWIWDTSLWDQTTYWG